MALRKTATVSSRKNSAKSAGKISNGGPIADFDRDEELKAYREMLLIRRFEEKAGQLYGMGFIGGFCHLYIGQEGGVTGMKMGLIDGGQMITAHRDHRHMLAMELSPRGGMGELAGGRGGVCPGKGGSPRTFS